MKLYLLLFIAFLVQEPISSNAVLIEAYQYHYNVWVIHALFVLATLLDTVIFHYIGRLVHEKYSQSKFVLRTKEKSELFTNFAGKNGKRAALFLYGPIIFPISAFIAPWLGISFWDSTIFLFMGDLIFWYGAEWLIVLGVKSFISNPEIALYVAVIISTVFFLGIRYFKRKSKTSV